MPELSDVQIDFVLISFLRQEEASAGWLAGRIGITRSRASARLQALQRRGIVTYNRVAWRYEGSGVRRTKVVGRL